jgi:hypothetical protein
MQGDSLAGMASVSLCVLVGYTYTAKKMRTLVAGVVSRYFHDARLYLVQLPRGAYTAAEDVMFYGLPWLMVGIGCVISRLAADRLGVRAPTELYDLESP